LEDQGEKSSKIKRLSTIKLEHLKSEVKFDIQYATDNTDDILGNRKKE